MISDTVLVALVALNAFMLGNNVAERAPFWLCALNILGGVFCAIALLR